MVPYFVFVNFYEQIVFHIRGKCFLQKYLESRFAIILMLPSAISPPCSKVLMFMLFTLHLSLQNVKHIHKHQ